jgi:hypothetical protein
MMAEAADPAEVEHTLLYLRDTLAQFAYRDWAQAMHDLMHDWQQATTVAERKQVAQRITSM